MSFIQGKGFWLAAAALVAFGLARALTFQATAREDILGKKAPAFELESVQGKTVRSSDLRGKVVVLDFWAVWCGPCKDAMPFFQNLHDKYGSEGLEVVGLHVNDRMPNLDTVQSFLDELDVHYLNLVSTTPVDDAFMIYAMPTTYLLDRDGVLRKRHIGFNPTRTPERLERDVKELLKID